MQAPHLELLDRLWQRIDKGEAVRAVVSMPPRHGKHIALDVPVWTPDGWKAHGDLAAGDQVYAPDGTATAVTEVHAVELRPTFLCSTDHGWTDVRASDAHLWRVRLDRKRAVWSVRTTAWLHERYGGMSDPRSPMLPPQRALVGEPVDLPIDPWVLGYWLGNGATHDSGMTGHLDDRDYVTTGVRNAGYETTTETTTTVARRAEGRLVFDVRSAVMRLELRTAGLLGNKHIPSAYFHASSVQRRALLHGLVDSDGHVHPDGQVEVTFTDERLMGDLVHLCRTLAIRVHGPYKATARLYGVDHGPMWRITFYDSDAASSPRKKAALRNPKRDHRYLDVEPTGMVEPVSCISVAHPSAMYLVGEGMIPTHNTQRLSRRGPAWYLNRHPDHRVILASYEADFAATHGRAVRDSIRDNPTVFGITVAAASSSASRWDITDHDGGMVTAGVGGAITGRGGNVLLVDDPVKNAEEALSTTYREKTWDWWRSTAYTRLEPGASAIVIMTRWHEDDLGGKILEHAAEDGQQWEFVRLPAIAETDDPLGRAPGEALWPERYPVEALENIRQTVGAFWFSAMYQGTPSPAAGGLFKREWFRTWRNIDDAVELDDGRRFARDDLICFTTVDLAASMRDRADFTVASTWWQTPDTDLLWVDCEQVRLEGPDQVDLLRRVLAKHHPSFIAVESVGYQLAFIQAASRAGLLIRALEARGDKVARALTASTRYSLGRMYHPVAATWLVDAETQILGFPNTAHDDIVDTVSYAAIQVGQAPKRRTLIYRP